MTARNDILIVEDQEKIRTMCTSVLENAGFRVQSAEDGEQALEMVQGQRFDLVITDIRMPGISGDLLIDRIKKIQPDMAFVIMTGFPTMELAIDAVHKGVGEFLTKPFRINDLKKSVEYALAEHAKETERAQRTFADSILRMEEELGTSFDLRTAIDGLLEPPESALDADHAASPRTESDTKDAKGPKKSVSADQLQGKPFIVIVCEAIPKDPNLLKTAESYRHFRTIYAAQKVLNSQLGEDSSAPVRIEIALANNSADIPRHARRFSRQICSIIFGPNVPGLSEATVRMMANSGEDRHVVVCHNSDQTNFSWDHLMQLSERISVKGCEATADVKETRKFWSQFFTQDLKEVIATKSKLSNGQPAKNEMLSPDEIRQKLEKDHIAMELLPGFPHVCQQVLQAIDQGARYTELAKIIQPDGGLQSSIIRTSNLARYSARQRVETLESALSMIGMEETRKIIMGTAMSELTQKVQQAGFDVRHFFLHSASVGYMAQILNLNVEEPSPKEQEIIQSLKLPPFILEILKHFKLWNVTAVPVEFNSFTCGVLHDVGKLLNTIIYQDIFPLVLYEIERTKWQGGLLASEQAVVGDFQHPVTGGALLAQWEIFPELIEPIRNHHHIDSEAEGETALIALANCLTKGFSPFPRMINIPFQYRETHLKPIVAEELLSNPLPRLFQQMTDAFEKNSEQVSVSQKERETGEYTPASIEALVATALETSEQESQTFMDARGDQNPELLALEERYELPAERLVAVTLLLKDTIVDLVNGLFQSTRAKKPK